MRDLSEEPFHAPLATDVGVWSVSSFVIWIHFLHLFKITMQPQSTVKKKKQQSIFFTSLRQLWSWIKQKIHIHLDSWPDYPPPC